MSIVVITPASAKALTTVRRVRAELALGDVSPPEPVVNRWIEQSSARAASYCRRQFGRQTVRERFPFGRASIGAPCDEAMILTADPIVRIVAVTVDGTVAAPETFEIEGNRLYCLDGDGRRIPWSCAPLAVDYEVGWLLPIESRGNPPTTTAADLPADIEAAVIKLVGVAVSSWGRDVMVKSEDVAGVGSSSWYVQGGGASLPHPEAESALTPYRRRLFA